MTEQSDYQKYRGKCKEMAEELCSQDSSLTLVRGHYYDYQWGEQAHWWCQKQDGTIVDPTKDQFPSKGMGIYTPFDGIVPCANCGIEVREEDVRMCGHYPVCSYRCYGNLIGF